MKKIRPLVFSISCLSIVLSSPAMAGSREVIYSVFDAGMTRFVAVDASGEGDSVVEVDADGDRLDGPFRAEPRVTLSLSKKSELDEVAARVGATSWRKGVIGGFYVLEFSDLASALEAAEKLWEQGYEASPFIARPNRKRFDTQPADPLFPLQWHLRNTGLNRGVPGIDSNVLPAWATVRGRDIFVGVADDGVQVSHPDLVANSFPVETDPDLSMHYNFQTELPDPEPVRAPDGSLPEHGTSVAGIVAASPNAIGGVGVAPSAILAGIVGPSGSDMDEEIARGMLWRHDILHIHNNSWGPKDDGKTTSGPGPQTAAAIEQAVLFGRDGKGVIFTWAGGNGRPEKDDSNYDGFANSIYSIAVGAVSDRQTATSDGESGANLVVVAPTSSRSRQGQISTDLIGADGYNQSGKNDGVIPRKNFDDLNYTNDFGMTSGATPVVSGVVALMLEANPDLGWRDVQEILLRTARRVSPRDRGWAQNPVTGWWFHHNFGAGMVDAAAAVETAADWTNLEASTSLAEAKGGLALPVKSLRNGGAEVTFDMSGHPAIRVEHVQFAVDLNCQRRGTLSFILTSPSGMQSIVPARPLDTGRNFGPWTFMSVRHWGESSSGIWKIQAVNSSTRFSATLKSAAITLHGAPL